MVDVTDCNNLNVLTMVVSPVEILDVVKTYIAKVVAVTTNWLTHHVVTESVEMHVLEKSTFVLGVVALVVHICLLLYTLKLFGLESCIAHDVS